MNIAIAHQDLPPVKIFVETLWNTFFEDKLCEECNTQLTPVYWDNDFDHRPDWFMCQSCEMREQQVW